MAQQLRDQTVLAEDTSSIPSTHIDCLQTPLNSSSAGSDASGLRH